jgi:hypothetical protein
VTDHVVSLLIYLVLFVDLSSLIEPSEVSIDRMVVAAASHFIMRNGK